MRANTFLRLACLTGLALTMTTLASAPLKAGAGNSTKPLALRTIMQDLNKNMQGITDRISHEDWAAVAALAPLLANHPQAPAAETRRIHAFLGKDAGKFEARDEATHHAVHALAEAARRKDGQAVISSYAKVQSSCMACHQDFRKPFVRHFYGDLQNGHK